MNRNINSEIRRIADILASENDPCKIRGFMLEMFTKSELETLSKRWQIMKGLSNGQTQREIANELKVSLCKVTRGSQILKDKKSVVGEYLKRGE